MEPAASRRAWERTERFFDAWLHPMAIANLHDARWLRVNHSFCSLLGWSPETALTMSLFDMVDSPDLAGVKEVVSRLSQGDHVEDWPVRIRRQDGSWTTVLWQAAGSPEDEVLSFVGRVREHSCFDAQQLRLAKDAAGLGIHDVDVATGVIRWDQRVRELWGVGPDEPVTYDTFISGVHEEDRAATEQSLNRAMDPTSDGRYRTEYRVVNRTDGATRWIAAAGQVSFAGEQPLRLIGTVQDITDRKVAETRLRESECQFRDTFENAAVGIAQVGLDGRWLRFNQRLCEITGYCDKELLNLTFGDITHPDDVETDWREARRLMAGEIGHYSMQKRYVRPDGTPVWVNLTVALQRDEQGAPRNFISVIEDIDARKQAEAQREHLIAEVGESQKRLHAVMDQMPSGLFIVEAPDGRIVAWNPEAERILGHPAIVSEGVSGYRDYGGLHPDGRPYRADEYPTARALVRGETVRQENMLYRRGDGAIIHLSVNAGPLRQDDSIAGAVCTFHDITEQRRLEGALREANERLALALESNRLGTWNWDIASDRVIWGGYCGPLFGLSDKSAGGTFREFLVGCVYPEDRDLISRQLNTCFASRRESYSQDFRTLWGDGSVHWLESRARVLYDAEGKPQRMIGVLQDITARKESEAALEAAQRGLRLALDAAQAGTFEICFDAATVPSVTGGVKKLFGFAPESSPVVHDYIARVHPEDRGRVEAAIDRSAQTGEGHFVEYRIARPDGSERWVASRAEVAGDGASGRLIGTLLDITAQKQTEALLRESEARFRIALHAGSYGVWEWIPQSGAIAADETVKRLFDLDLAKAEVSADEVFAQVHADDREAVIQALHRGLEPGQIYEAEFRVRTPDGSLRWLAGFGELVRDAAGNPLRMVGINRDITDRKRAEEALRRRELELSVERDRLANVFEMAPAFITVLRGPRHIFELANTAYYRIVGNREILGKPLIEALPELKDQGFDRILDEVLRTGKPFVGTGLPALLRRTADAEPSEAFFDFVYTPLVEADGTRSGVVAIGYDVTERVRAEQAEQVLQEQLIRSAAEFRQIADSLPQLVWVTRPDGHHEWYNRRWYEYTGSSFEQSEGAQWAGFFHPDDAAEAQRRWAHSLRTGERYRVEYRCRRHDGAWRWFLGQAEPIRDEDGTILRWFGTCTDIHDQKITEDALRTSNEDLQRFAYIAGHDLQEPLRVIVSFSQLLSRRYRGRIDSTADEYIQYITGAADRMSRLIRDLLVYAQSTDSGDLRKQDVDAGAAVELAVENLQARVDETAATITHDALPVVPAAESLLVQVFQNLIGNALKYTRPGTPPRVHVSAHNEDGCWIFSVRDNGQGIAPEHQTKLFQLFTRLHGREVSGTGIGLATVKRIVERHGGSVWLESEPGVGSTFYFSMPEKSRQS